VLETFDDARTLDQFQPSLADQPPDSVWSKKHTHKTPNIMSMEKEDYIQHRICTELQLVEE